MTRFAKADFCARCGGSFVMPSGKTLKGVATKNGVVHWAVLICVRRERRMKDGYLVAIGKEEGQ